jgi:hypothetical protein
MKGRMNQESRKKRKRNSGCHFLFSCVPDSFSCRREIVDTRAENEGEFPSTDRNVADLKGFQLHEGKNESGKQGKKKKKFRLPFPVFLRS